MNRGKRARAVSGGKIQQGAGKLAKSSITLTKPPEPIVEPTAERAREFELTDICDRGVGLTVKVGKAYRRKPMISTLLAQGILSAREYTALQAYRHYASLAEKSPIRDSLTLERYGGTGAGPANEILHAMQVTGQCESAAGSLADILRAVVVDDRSLSDWAVEKHGGTEKCRDRKGKPETTIEPTTKALGLARMEIKFAAGRVQAQLDA